MVTNTALSAIIPGDGAFGGGGASGSFGDAASSGTSGAGVSNAEASVKSATGPKYSYLKFPLNLGEGKDANGTNARYPHFMVFYINVNTKSSLGKDASQTVAIDLTQRTAGVGVAQTGTVGGTTIQGTANATGQINTTTLGAFVGGIAGAAAVGPLGALGGAAIGAGVGAIAGSEAVSEGVTKFGNSVKDAIPDTFKSSKKRLLTAIMLPMPNNVSSNTTATYVESGIGGIAGTLFQGVANGQAGKGLQDAGAALVQQAPKHVLVGLGAGVGKVIAKASGADSGASMAAGAVAGFASSENFKDVLSKLSGLAENPRSEQVFRAVQPRTYTFEWLLAPRSQAESIYLYNIIQTFKARMLPELDANNTFLIMPDEWDITYNYKDSENIQMGKIATSVLTSVNVNYTPHGYFTAFAGTGNPVMIHLSLNFTEVEPLLRNMIETMGF